MTRDDFKNALRESASLRHKDILNDTSGYTFSDSFEKRMNKLIKSVNSYGIKSPKHYNKWAAVVAASLVLFFSATIIHVSSTPADITIMKVTKYPTYYEVTFKGYVTTNLLHKYKPGYIPEGYTLYTTNTLPNNILYIYTNADGAALRYSQEITGRESYHRFPMENVTSRKLATEKVDATLYDIDGTYMVIWIQNNYFMKLSFNDKLSDTEIIKIIESITLSK